MSMSFKKKVLINSIFYVLLTGVSLCIVPQNLFAQQLLPEIHTLAVSNINYVYKEQFKQAEDEARKIIKKYPENPAGYFFCAAALESWMSYYETNKREEEFYSYCDLTIEKAENCLKKDPNDDWAMFFLGGADGYKGTYESRYEKWITSFRHGWKGVSTLMTLYKKNPTLKDISYGLGMYDYWRSALTKVLWWMPGIENRCDVGIKELYVAKNEGLYTSISASTSLIFILNNEKHYVESIKCADEMLAKYPGSLIFCWGKAAALFGAVRYAEAEAMYRFILGKVEAESFDNHYNSVVCRFWLAKIYLAEKNYSQCIAECNKIGYYTIDNDIKKRLEKYFADIAKIQEQAQTLSSRKTATQSVP